MQAETLPKTNYMGSKKNYESVRSQLCERYNEEIAKEYDPFVNCRTYNDWKRNGYLVNKGAKSFRAVVVVEKKDKDGKVIKKVPRTICLFFKNQVHSI